MQIDGPGEERHLFFDEQSGLLTKMKTHFDDQQLEYRFEYRELEDGSWFVSKCRQYSDKRLRMTMEITNVEFGPEVNASLFIRPENLKEVSPPKSTGK